MLFSIKIPAQSANTIEGFVKNNDQKAVFNADLLFISKTKSYNVTTDDNGAYKIDLPNDFYTVEVHCVGFISKNVNKYFERNTLLNFILENESSSLKEVVVLSRSKKMISVSSGNTLSFIPEKLASIPSIMGVPDIIKLLQLTPGVQNSGDANGYLYVRGSEPGHNLMLYADAPIYGMAHLLGVFPFYNADHVQEVHFDKSNSNARNGGRLSATVAVLNNKSIPTKFSVKGNLGLLASQATFAVPISPAMGFYISSRKTYIDEIIAPLIGSFDNNENSDVKDLRYTFGDSNLTFIAAFKKSSMLTIDAFTSGDVLRISDSNLALNANLKWSNTTISPNWRYQLSDRIVMTNLVYFSKYENSLNLEQATVQMRISSMIKDYGFSNAVTYSIGDTSYETGMQWSTYELQPQKIEVSNLSSNGINQQSVINRANNLAVYVNAKPSLSDKIFTELGLRINYYSSINGKTSYFRAEPRILLNYIPQEKTSFFVSYTLQNQYLNLITTSSVGIPTDFWVASSDGIPAQSSNEFSMGYNQKLKKQLDLSLSSFYRTMNNLIEYPYGVTQFNEISSFKNDVIVGNGKSYGLESMLKKDYGNFKGWLSYTLSWANRRFDKINAGEQYFAKFDRRHNLALAVTYDLNPKWNFGLTQIFSSGNRFTTPTSWYFINNNPVKEYGKYNNAQMPNYIRTDLSINYFFIKKSDKESALNFAIFNTFNIVNPIYTVLNVSIDSEKQKIEVTPERKTLYSILPSVSWRFKF